MRKYFLSLVAMAAMILFSGCNKNEDFYISDNGDMVTFNIATPEMGTRAISDGTTATNLTVAVYNSDTKAYLPGLTQDLTINKTATVQLPLVAGITYDIVFWAYNPNAPYAFDKTTGKVSIDYKTNEVAANNEYLDAFYANRLGYEVKGQKTETVELTRPFAQLNVATLDYDLAAKSGIEVTSTAITVDGVYTSLDLRSNGAIIADKNTEPITLTLNQTPSVAGQTLQGYTEYTWLSMNYLLVNEKTTISATMTTNNNKVTREWHNIPVQRNFRTNILGNILTTTTDFNVVIDERFAGDVNPAEWDGTSIIEPKEIDGVYHIDGAAQLAWLAAAVNGTIPTKSDFEPAQSFKGKTFELGMDIDLKGKPWTPIGNNGGKKFEGTFDGKGFTISNITVAPKDANDNAPKGLFGAASYVKNLTVKNVNISGHYKTGAIVGDGLCSRINNCHVDGGVVVSTPNANKDNGNHAGGIVGYLSAENEAYVKNSSVKNLTITAYRDVAGIAGTATASNNNKAEISNCLVENTTITADQSCEYIDANKAGNAGEIVGRNTKNIDLSSNRAVNVTVVGTYFSVNSNEEVENALDKNDKHIFIELKNDVSINVNAWETLAFGGDKTETITIEGNERTITFNHLNSDWNNIATANGAKLIINNATITNSGKNDGPWNRHDLNFACDVELNNVISNKAIALKAAATLNKVTISDNNTSDTYAIWIQPKGQKVVLNECTIDMLVCTDGRGIKIDQQYLGADDIKKVTLNVSNTTFKTEEKGAIIVKSAAGADIVLNSVNIESVAADQVNAVWVDEDAAEYYDLVTVTGGYKIIEGSVRVTPENFNTFNRQDGNVIIILGEGNFGTIVANSNKTYIGSEKAKVDCINLNGADNVTIKNITFDAKDAKIGCNRNGEAIQPANIITGQHQGTNPTKGANNVTIDGCVFGGTFADGGVVIAFTDQGRTGSGNITIKNCVFNTNGGYAEIYTHYSGNNGFFKIENNTFNSTLIVPTPPIYLNLYQSSVPVVVNNNHFANLAATDKMVHLKAHSSAYSVSYTADGNTFGK